MIRLSDSEISVMRVIWKKGTATSVEILNYIKEKKEISPNSVRTLLTRLVKKKAILVSGKVGKSYTYEALLTKEEFLRTETEHFLNTLCDGSAVPLILSYFKQGLITKEYLIELYNSIDEE